MEILTSIGMSMLVIIASIIIIILGAALLIIAFCIEIVIPIGFLLGVPIPSKNARWYDHVAQFAVPVFIWGVTAGVYNYFN